MQPTYEELFAQNQTLIKQLNEALAEIQGLKLEIQQLKVENQLLKSEIKDLKDKLNTNSSNSSKSPSQDPFRERKKNKETGRTQGAQKGHQGHSRRLIPIEQVQTLYDLKPNVCPDCQSNFFDKGIIRTEVRQVVELPEMPPEVTQYNIHTCRCSSCGKHVKADIPNEAKYGFGPRLMALVTSLSGEFRLSKRQVTTLMGKIGIRICSGSICKIHNRACQILKDPYEEIKTHTLKKDHLNADETSWRTLAKMRWVWIGCCKIRRIEEGPKQDMKLWFKIGVAHEDCQNKTKATCMDFFNRFDMLWVFVYKENIEPTNNAAEQGLRHGVIWRKLSYGTQSEVGERFVERVMTVAETLKRQARNSFDYFTNCFREFIQGGHSPPVFGE